MNTIIILKFNYINWGNAKYLFKQYEEVKIKYLKNFLIPYHLKRITRLKNLKSKKRITGFWKISLIEEIKYFKYLKSII